MSKALHWLPLCMVGVAALVMAGDRSVLKRQPEPKAPEAGITIPVRITNVVDGDTLDVQVTFPIRVRLRDCWAREKSESGGPEATSALKKMAMGKQGRMRVLLDGISRTDELFTFGRLLADVYVGDDGRSLSEQMVAKGLATPEKRR